MLVPAQRGDRQCQAGPLSGMAWHHLCAWSQVLTQELHSTGEPVDVDQGPERLCCPHATEEEHGSRVIDPVENPALLVHPEGNDVSLVCKLFWQSLGPKPALGNQVRARVLWQSVRVNPRWVLGSKAESKSPAPATLLFSDLQRQQQQ